MTSAREQAAELCKLAWLTPDTRFWDNDANTWVQWRNTWDDWEIGEMGSTLSGDAGTYSSAVSIVAELIERVEGVPPPNVVDAAKWLKEFSSPFDTDTAGAMNALCDWVIAQAEVAE